MTLSPAARPGYHAVRAELSTGWYEQPCATTREAWTLFDRLTRYEGVTIERIQDGVVVEIRKGALAPRLHQLAVRTPLAA